MAVLSLLILHLSYGSRTKFQQLLMAMCTRRSKAQSSLLARAKLSPGHENANNSRRSDSSTVWPARLGAKLMPY